MTIPNMLKTIDKFKQNYRKHLDLQRAKVNIVHEGYPELSIDYDNDRILLNEDVLDLNPKTENVKSDLQQLAKVFSNFDNFIDHNGALGFTHFKLMNTMFVSPFIARLRCSAFYRDIGTQSMPLFLLLYSEGSNCGKTFMVKFMLKEIYKVNKDSFIVKDDFVNIEFGSEDAKKVKSIVHTLPEELEPRLASTRENITLSVKKDCLEKCLGIKLRKKFLGIF